MIETRTADHATSKGFTLLGAQAFVEERFGQEAKWTLFSELDPDTHQIVTGPILPSGWYPFRAQVALYEAIDRVFGEGDLALCREIGKFTCDYEMTRIHKVFLKLANLELWVRSSGLMWGRYYSNGRLDVEEIGEKEGVLKVADFNPLSKAFCYDFAGWLHRTLELNQRENVTVEHTDCVLDGASTCRFVGHWDSTA